MDITLAIIGLFLVLVGIAGSVLPVLPGPPISWAGLLILKWTRYVDNNLPGYTNLLWTMAFIVVIVTILDYVVPIWGTKKFGGSKRGVWGATLGLVAGMFFGPPGIILGPFLGAYIGEITTGKKEREALRAAWGSFVGFLTGVGLKLMTCGVILFFFIKYWAF